MKSKAYFQWTRVSHRFDTNEIYDYSQERLMSKKCTAFWARWLAWPGSIDTRTGRKEITSTTIQTTSPRTITFNSCVAESRKIVMRPRRIFCGPRANNSLGRIYFFSNSLIDVFCGADGNLFYSAIAILILNSCFFY